MSGQTNGCGCGVCLPGWRSTRHGESGGVRPGTAAVAGVGVLLRLILALACRSCHGWSVRKHTFPRHDRIIQGIEAPAGHLVGGANLEEDHLKLGLGFSAHGAAWIAFLGFLFCLLVCASSAVRSSNDLSLLPSSLHASVIALSLPLLSTPATRDLCHPTEAITTAEDL